MKNIDQIKAEIRRLYNANADILVHVKMTHPRRTSEPVLAVIKSVYPNFFCIEENSGSSHRCHSIQYAEILIGQVNISELK